jgi:hypothetical protein
MGEPVHVHTTDSFANLEKSLNNLNTQQSTGTAPQLFPQQNQPQNQQPSTPVASSSSNQRPTKNRK